MLYYTDNLIYCDGFPVLFTTPGICKKLIRSTGKKVFTLCRNSKLNYKNLI